ncbi:hypothetical protein PY254_16520 [Rhodanobacter sp. AS-Z3]|uniref:hypothetical protein n=1 Tax=Rhodanobacter sp. AS-Z3 TaxID=3031330 RepID=UPI00247A0496|nr:hypothetical protein [Rhodanobacter sp. AS-Z3]WEN14815.1 hypothetical protein PY254_16520 [Rhodanobacter sp. AS-Z3]
MIELEIQGLSQSREGLLIEVGRFVLASGFTLRSQRLLQDPHGMLLTMVVRGPARKQRALEALLENYDRLVSFHISPFVEGEVKPHFGATVKRATYLPPPAPLPPPEPAPSKPAPVAAPATSVVLEPFVTAPVRAKPLPREALQTVPAAPPEPDFEFILPTSRAPAAAPAALEDVAPFVDVVALGPDEAAVGQMLQSLEHDYPKIMPKLLALQGTVAEGARDASLTLAGQRAGSWLYAREYSLDSRLSLHDALERIAAPALRALVEVDLQGTQLHILASPLCSEGGHSGCSFFSGFLDGLLAPLTAPARLSIFPVCCRSYGADECVLAFSD